MSFPALLYTAAAIAFFIMMVNRPAVEVQNTFTQQTPNAESVQASNQTDQQSVDATAETQLVVSSGWDENNQNAATGDSPDSAKQTNAADSNEEQSSTDNATQAESETAAATNQATTKESESSEGDNTPAADTTDNDASSSTQTTNAATQQASSTAKPNYARERRLGNEIRDAILDGEVLYLHDGSRNFMSIQTDASEKRGGAVILHGRGFHPDWEDTINPLRVGLAEAGWTTVSLQLPVLKKDAKYYDYVPLFPEAGQRIKAGIQHLKDQGVSPIALVAHSCGVHMAVHWLDENGDADIDAFVGLGMGATDYQQPMQQPLPLEKLKVPVFDAYGAEDFPAVIKMAPKRWEAIKQAGNPQSEQRLLPDADHYFKGKDDEVTALVSTWLNGLTFK